VGKEKPASSPPWPILGSAWRPGDGTFITPTSLAKMVNQLISHGWVAGAEGTSHRETTYVKV
jgi:hypothetical protein